MKLNKSLMSVFKYLAWTAVAALIAALSGNLDHLSVPVFLIPIVASLLKGIATFIATQQDSTNPDK
jgi:hypothetical protein